MRTLSEYRELAIQLQSVEDLREELDRLKLTSKEYELLLVIVSNYAREAFEHMWCYFPYDIAPYEIIQQAERTTEVRAILYKYVTGIDYVIKDWSYSHHAMIYKYFPDKVGGQTTRGAGRLIASKYRFSDQWVNNFAKRVSSYSTKKQRTAAPNMLYEVFSYAIYMGWKLPVELIEDLEVLRKK